ncbi:hypothetical protein EB796_025239 [Bugula neritina]|uniref:Uncharacterized protein n=1 Tax=Bugula neritina TaxID=10212 RepID=A0A7J7ITB9_BUGNE|nr:hypothetical protein EB796_025239 [Bugula neritina]
MCFKCSKNECIDGVKHKVVEYEEELVNTAKTKLDKWKKDKIRDIDFLSNQQTRVVAQFRTVSYLVTVENFMIMAEQLNVLVNNFLQVMCALADKNGELQRAKPDVELTDLEIVRVVHQLPKAILVHLLLL